MTLSRQPFEHNLFPDRLRALLVGETTVYILKRLAQAALTLLLASALCFAIMQLAPGDYVTQWEADPRFRERIAELREQFWLDRPAYLQYGRWLWRVVTQGNFGISFRYSFQPVTNLLWERIPATLLLSIVSLFLTWAVALPLGVIAAVNQSRFWDNLLRVLSYIGQAFPSFVTGLLLLFLAQNLSPLFPIGDMTSIYFADLSWFGKLVDIGWHLILPTLALTITSFAGLQRVTRGQLLDVLRQDYIRTARAKGLPENKVIYIHALRNAINPLITLLGFEFATLLSGAFITEYYFNWPGLGRLTLEALRSQDLYLALASLMMGAVMLILGNLLADLLLKFADPRIKLTDLE